MADLAVSADQTEMLVTYALGSCVAVILYDPARRAGGMLHFKLPESKIAPGLAQSKPGTFADTGIPLLFRHMRELGCPPSSLVVKATGGGALHDTSGVFGVGSRNAQYFRAIMRDNRIPIAAEDLGGRKSRTVSLEIATGRVVVLARGSEVEL
jgi:chemotaxis protein CheD